MVVLLVVVYGRNCYSSIGIALLTVTARKAGQTKKVKSQKEE